VNRHDVRESTKHGPRMDDALKSETRSLEQGAPIEARVEEGREKEGPADADRDVDVTTAPPGSLGSDPVEARRELSRHLRMSVFPASRDELVAEAESQNAPSAVTAAVARLRPDETFATVHEVWAALEGEADPHEAARTDPLTDADR
jgi:Protein of unknown function (DUF2795)